MLPDHDTHRRRAQHVPFWVELLPLVVGAARHRRSPRSAYIWRPELPARDRARFRAALPVPAQQMVFRRALRLALRAAGAARSARLLWKSGDGTIIDGLGPDGIAARRADCRGAASRLQTGYVYHYAFAMLIGVVALVTWYLLS